jgi:hypothetical protein
MVILKKGRKILKFGETAMDPLSFIKRNGGVMTASCDQSSEGHGKGSRISVYDQ